MARLTIKDLTDQIARLQAVNDLLKEGEEANRNEITNMRVKETERGAEVKLLKHEVRVSLDGIRHYQLQRDTLIGFCEAGRRNKELSDTRTGLDSFLDSIRVEYIAERDFRNDPMDRYR